jgi:high-affinity Fe2+/Pb2+ permease
MDTTSIISFLQESLFMVLVFVGFLAFAISAGRQSITNVILGLYFALLISIEFPYYDMILGTTSSKKMESIVMLIVFAIFTLGATILFARLMPREYSEGKFEGFWKKILLACAATVLVMAFSYHALPVTEIITPGSPIQYLFGSKSSFFWWLLAPLGILFVV